MLEFAEENLDFYVASEYLLQLSDEAAVRRAFEKLFTHFISKTSSPHSINISENLYNKLNCLNSAWGATRIEQIVDLVSEAQSEIAHMLEFDSFPRFFSRNPDLFFDDHTMNTSCNSIATSSDVLFLE